jgi:hypothetical protein
MFPGAALFLQLVAATPADPGASPVTAPSDRPDTTYGRLDGDVGIVVGAGVAVGPGSPRGAVDLRLRYMETAGLFFSYEDGFGSGAEPVRVLSGGLELRPLFIARWLNGNELGSARVDLAIDSIGFELGGFFAQPQGEQFASRPGLQVGVGLELPILATASGPWIGLHGGMRFSDAELGGRSTGDSADKAFFLAITLAWHQIVGTHVVDPMDRAPR